MINGVDSVIITLLDALEGVNPLKICTGYELEGRDLESWPIQSEIIEQCKPIYKTFNGWEPKTSEEWSEIAKQGYEALPLTMKTYLQFIKEELQKNIAMISIGPDRNDTIVIDENLF